MDNIREELKVAIGLLLTHGAKDIHYVETGNGCILFAKGDNINKSRVEVDMYDVFDGRVPCSTRYLDDKDSEHLLAEYTEKGMVMGGKVFG